MAGTPFRHRPVFSRSRLRVVALASVVVLLVGISGQGAVALPTVAGNGLPPVKMLGYAAGPAQHTGTAAGKAHYVPASATRAGVSSKRATGHPAPRPGLAPQAMGTNVEVRVGSAQRVAGHLVVGHRVVTSSTRAAAPPASITASTTALVRPAISGTDNASYSVASTYDTTPMADQTGRIAVTLTNTGTSTWTGYALGSQVFPSGDTTGTGAPVTTGVNVPASGSVPPGGTATVESVTPAENPGSYEICWDMVNAPGTYFSAEGGAELCAAYTIQQYPPQINEQEPLPGTDVDTQQPTLSASAVIPGGYPASPSFSYAFEIISGPNLSTATVQQSSGWVASNSDNWTPATALTWGQTYYWVATVTDVSNPSTNAPLARATWTTPISFIVGGSQAQVGWRLGNAYTAQDGNPVMTSDLGGTDYTGSGKTVDPKSGNVSMQATDASVATVGPALTVARTYNSLDPRTSQAFGAGWSSAADMSLVPDPDGSGALILTLADGKQVRFAKNAAGGYAPPQSLYAVVATLSGGGLSVTDQTGTRYDFGQASGSSWLVSKITDENGMSQTFTYSGTTPTTITSNVSGRSLHLTWATPSGAAHPHVASASTDPVTAGQPGTALTWTYGYAGDLLTSVCPPASATQCTTYSYIANGSHAPTSVLNANPTAYFRLDDPAGSTAAANQVPVNDLTTVNPPATEMNTTLGQAGPVTGVTATGFNGTSSWIPLDGVWCTTPGSGSSCSTNVGGTGRVLGSAVTSEAFSVWFKTTTAGGVLVSTDPVLPGQACFALVCTGTPDALLSIGSNGHLQSQGCQATSCTTVLSSPAAVNNGQWHQAVLIPGRALYLDGSQVATSTGNSTAADGTVAVLGAGLVPSNCQSNCGSLFAWSYFNGSLADLSIYQNQLPGAGTVVAQYAAETTPAAELSAVTTPAGRSEFAATYDTVNDRVATVTDANGGTWTYGDPVTSATSAAYGNAVLGTSPEDFWPLNDTAGPAARDLTGTSPAAASPRPAATYANVTLGAAGPTGFPDGPAARFTGSGSQVAIPGGYWAGTGAESAELWFSTSAAKGTLLSTGAGPAGGNPVNLWITGGCLEATIGATDLNFTSFLGNACLAGTNVANGKWHQAVLTLSPVTGSTLFPGSGTTYSQTATLYLDGKSLATATATPVTTASSTGYTAYVGNGSQGDFTGSIADVSFYTRELSASDVSGHQGALTVASGVTSVLPSGVTAPVLNTQTITVTSPVGATTRYMYSGGALVQVTYPLGGVSRYGYDSALRAATLTDPDGDTTYTTHDAHNNVTSTTTCAQVGNCQTAYASYYENLSSPLDPRNDKPTDDRDPRSSSPTDPTYDTVTTYTATGLIATRRTPPTAACPSGCVTTHSYTTGTEAAAGGGTEPAGLLESVTTPGGGTAAYAYDAAGDLMTATDPLGLVTRYTYDNLGRKLTTTQVSDTYPAGLRTSYAYDSLGNILTTTYPAATDRVTHAVHTQVVTATFDPDGLVLTNTISDGGGADPSRTATHVYDQHGNLSSSTDPLGNITTFTYDAFGDKASETDPAGRTLSFSYDALGHLLTTTLHGYTGNPGNPQPAVNLVLESRAYDPAGRLASVTHVNGAQTSYTYYGNNKLASSYIPDPGSGTGQADVTTYSYDPEGNITGETLPGGLVVTAVVNAANQVASGATDPAGADLTTSATYDPDGNVIARSLTGGGTTETATAAYNVMDELMSSTVADGSTNLTTTYTRDERGLVTSVTDPDGNTAHYQNDELGRPVTQTLPPVPSQDGTGGAVVTANPLYTTGFDTFGDATESSDADGNITTAAYDQDGGQTSVTAPPYTPPGATSPVNGTTTLAYDSLGQETSQADPLGNLTKYTYDQLGDLASQTDADGGTWTYAYDPAGEQTSVTDPTGAQTQATYDSRGRMITSTQLVRQNTSAAYTTTYGYDDAGNQTSVATPTGVTATAAYNALGELASRTDGAGNITSYAYNLDGQPDKVTLPDGSGATTTYDQAGNLTSESQLGTTGTTLRTASAGYDPDGNLTSATDFRGITTTAAYDAAGNLTTLTQPVTATKNIQLSFGYDRNGDLTRQTDGNGDATFTSYNSRGLPQATAEPPTAQYTSDADSTTTRVYNADGNLVQQTMPGGVQVTGSYDPMGRLLTQAGTGATAATAARTYTYDTAGRMLTAATAAAGTQGSPGYQPATSDTFSYDDRGLLLAAAGGAGASSFGYNASGQLASETDPSGTSTYGYGHAGLLATDSDAASGATGTYSYNNLGQVTSISYGSGNDTQSFSYDPLHRLASDALSTAAGTQVAAVSYGYDPNDDITSMTTSGLAAAGGGTGAVTNAYGYDLASRLTSWSATPAGGTAATTSYGYDDAGNLTSNGSTTYSYDARDELTSDSRGNTYSYAANGDLTAQTAPGGAVTSFTSDAYGQQVTDAGSSYTWDALDRVTAAATGTGTGSASVALSYSGTTGQLTGDGTATYSRDPGGALVGINSAGGRTLALSNTHDDLVATFAPAGATLASSATYDPWGQVIAVAGPAVQIGYQGQWTDPLTGQVNMGSRFYSPARGSFLNHDTAAAGNPYAYAGDNPVTVTDLTGHSPDGDSSGAGQITQGQVDQAKAAAAAAEKKAVRAKAAAARARATEAHDLTALNAAASYAREMNNKAAQASQANTEAQAQATQALMNLDAYVIPYGGLQALKDKVASIQAQLQKDEQALWAAEGGTNVSVVVCTVPASGGPCIQDNTSPQALIDYGFVWLDQYNLQVAQGELSRAESLQSTYQKLKSKADSLWNKWQKAQATATAADNALSRAKSAYAQAVTTADNLAGDATAAASAATDAENYYQKLKDEYDQQQKAKKKAKKPPVTCSTSCIAPHPGPRPIPEPLPPVGGPSPAPGSGPGSNPNPNPNPSPPGDNPTPDPDPGGSGQGAGGGGGSGGSQAPSCSDEGDGSPAGNVPTMLFSRSKGPGLAQTFDTAVAGGAPTRLERVGAAARDINRRAALRGQKPPPAGQSLDEYPFACSKQGGAGSVVRAVPRSEQNYQGGVISSFFQNNNVGVGDLFNVEFGP